MRGKCRFAPWISARSLCNGRDVPSRRSRGFRCGPAGFHAPWHAGGNREEAGSAGNGVPGFFHDCISMVCQNSMPRPHYTAPGRSCRADVRRHGCHPVPAGAGLQRQDCWPIAAAAGRAEQCAGPGCSPCCVCCMLPRIRSSSCCRGARRDRAAVAGESHIAGEGHDRAGIRGLGACTALPGRMRGGRRHPAVHAHGCRLVAALIAHRAAKRCPKRSRHAGILRLADIESGVPELPAATSGSFVARSEPGPAGRHLADQAATPARR